MSYPPPPSSRRGPEPVEGQPRTAPYAHPGTRPEPGPRPEPVEGQPSPRVYGSPPADPTGNPFLGGQSVEGPPETERPSATSTWLAVGLSVVLNLTTLIGVINFGWPPGNVFALFWIENVIIGIWSLVKVATARGGNSAATTALFFCFHYGLFCLVHGVFTAIVVFQIGFQPTFWWLGLPTILIMIRYSVETLTTWFGPGAQQQRLTPKEAMAIPYPRIIVLHFAILISFGMTMGSGQLHDIAQGIQDALRPVLTLLPPAASSEGVTMILILIVIKTAVDIATTRKAVTK